MRWLMTAAVMASLAACTPSQPACTPSPGDACPTFDNPADARAFVAAQAWCPDGAEPVVYELPHGDAALACESASGGWSIEVGAVGRAWGLVYLASNGSLVVCDNAGRVEDVVPLLHDATGRYWHALSPDDAACLDTGACSVAPDPCGQEVAQ